MDALDPRLNLSGPLFLCNLGHFLPCLEVLLGANLLVLAVVRLAGHWLLALRLEHDNASSALGRCSYTEICARLDVEVWDAVLLAQDREVHDHVHGGDIAGDDDKTRGGGICRLCAAQGALLDSLFALLHATANSLELGALLDQLVDLLVRLVIGERQSEGNELLSGLDKILGVDIGNVLVDILLQIRRRSSVGLEVCIEGARKLVLLVLVLLLVLGLLANTVRLTALLFLLLLLVDLLGLVLALLDRKSVV